MRRETHMLLTSVIGMIAAVWDGGAASACHITDLMVTSSTCTLTGYEGIVPVYRCPPESTIDYEITVDNSDAVTLYAWQVNGDTVSNANASTFSHTLKKTGQHTVEAMIFCGTVQHSKQVLPVIPFTITVTPAAGGTMKAGPGIDDGIDCAEGDAGSTKCTERYEQNAVSLKVVTDAGWTFTGGTVNGIRYGANDFIMMVSGKSGELVTLVPNFEPLLDLQRVAFFGSECIAAAQDDRNPQPLAP